MFMNSKKITVKTFFEYVFVFVTLLQCNSVFYSLENTGNKRILIIWYVLLLLLFFLNLMELHDKKINIVHLIKFQLIFVTLMSAFLIGEYIYYPYDLKNALMYLFIPFCMVCIFYTDFKVAGNLILKIRNVTVVLAVVSLFFWFLSIIGVSPNMSVNISWGSTHSVPGYFHLHFIAQGSINFLGINTIRNTGVFDEAPMYSYVLCIAFLIHMFIPKQFKIMDFISIILIITILSTTSTTGIIILLLSILYYELFVNHKINKLLTIFVGIFLLPIVYFAVRNILIDKIDSNWYSSSSIRLNDLIAGFMAWKDHILIGNGIFNYKSIVNYMNYNRIMTNITGYSSGIMTVLAYGGLLLLLFYLVPTLLTMFVSRKDFAIGLFSFILFIFTVVNNVYLYIILLSFFWARYLTKDDQVKINIT